MSNITFTVDYTGTPNSGDAEAALYAVTLENQDRETPLPTSPNAALKTSYLTIMAELVASRHADHQRDSAANKLDAEEVRERWKISTDAQRAAAVAELAPLP